MTTDKATHPIRSRRLRGPSTAMFICILGLIFFLPVVSVSAEEHCSPEMNNKAISLLREAGDNWQSLLAHQKKFAVCDDGELGEGYSDAVARLFSQKWDQFGTFVTIALKDPAFQHWAFRHIDGTASDSDLKAIAHNASVCIDRKGAKNLCKAIGHSAENALRESMQAK